MDNFDSCSAGYFASLSFPGVQKTLACISLVICFCYLEKFLAFVKTFSYPHKSTPLLSPCLPHLSEQQQELTCGFWVFASTHPFLAKALTVATAEKLLTKQKITGFYSSTMTGYFASRNLIHAAWTSTGHGGG